jgi:hypothetical protein
MTMMTTEEIETEFGWCEDKIRALLRFPDSIKTRRRQHTHERYELYSRDRVLAASQTAEGRVTEREWMKRNVVIDPAQVGQHGWAISHGNWALPRSQSGDCWNNLNIAPINGQQPALSRLDAACAAGTVI